MSRENERRSAFKQTIGDGDGRRRREETTRQIRKNKREEQLAKRRQLPSETAPVVLGMDVSSMPSTNTKASVSDIPSFKIVLMSPSSTIEELTEATKGIRRILSTDRDPPVDEVLASGVLPALVANLTANPQAATLIFESAWALTNISSTEKTDVVVEAGAVVPLIQLLRHESPEVRDQAAWCLGNIAGDNTQFRDILLNQGIVEPLVLNLVQPASMGLLNNVTWTLSNLCRRKPSPDLSFLAPAIGPLAELLFKEVSVDVRVDAVWALSYLSDGPNERIENVMQTGVVNKLVALLEDQSSPVLMPTIRCLGNFVTGSDIQTQAVLDAGIMKHLESLLEHPRRTVRKETCWLASNIAAGTHGQITALLSNASLMGLIISTATDSHWETKKEALWIVSNICTTGTKAHVEYLMELGGLSPLADILGSNNADAVILTAALDGIERVLSVGEHYASMLDELQGVDYLENLQEHPSNEVYEKAIKIIETYFGSEDIEDENMAPVTTSSGQFGFGVSSPKQLFPSFEPSAQVQQPFQFGAISNRG
eukprot:Nitzschia sp. Nitz4//scaffold301_size22573//11579//13331//NITZ4_008554-RA/size22573-augustus-gene-0.6-mRNA-1//1//CDS//3329547016//438//frame0